MLNLELLHKNQPVQTVTEYSEIELRLSNQGQQPQREVELRLGGRVLRANLSLAAGASWSIPFNVDDLVGELVFSASCPGLDKATATLLVIPQKLSLEETLWLKIERLPTLLARLDAPNALRLRYNDDAERYFDYFSPDYTAEKLRHFSDSLLALGETLLDRLDYATPEKLESGYGVIRGTVRWPATIENWLNRPELAGIRHHWTTAPKTFATLPNLLLGRFHLSLSQQIRQLLKLVEVGYPASSRLRAILPEFSERVSRHHSFIELPYFQDLLPLLQPEIDLTEVAELETACLAAPNPAYANLWHLWQEFRTRYVSLPEDEETLARAGLQPMNRIYELWATCEVAAALELNFEGEDNTFKGASATFSNSEFKLYYNQGVSGGWYSATRAGVARPDLRLQRLSDDKQILLDVKYRTGGQERANPDDVYKMLAYMNDFKVNIGGIIYPAATPTPHVIDDARGQRLLEIPLRPPLPTTESAFIAQLRALILYQLAN